MKDFKEGSEYKMKRKRPERKMEIEKETTDEDRSHTKGGEKNMTWKENETLEKHM